MGQDKNGTVQVGSKAEEREVKLPRLGEGLAAVLAALIVALSSIFTQLITENRSAEREKQAQIREDERDRQTRFREERKAAYIEFLTAGLDLAYAPLQELESRRQQDRRRMEKALGEISLVASEQVIGVARGVDSQCKLLRVNPVALGQCRAELEQFRKTVRQELGTK